MVKPTKMAEEAKNEAAKTNQPSSAMLALFAKPQGTVGLPVLGGFKRMNQPQLVKPDVIPIGGMMTAVITDIIPSPVTTIKGKLLWLTLVTLSEKGQPVATGKDITFPCTGVIRSALAPGVDGEEKLQSALEKHKGKLLIVIREDDQLSTKYRKPMFMFDVRLSEKTVDIQPAKE